LELLITRQIHLKESIMKLRNLLIADTVISLLFAVALLLGPATTLKFFGLTQGKTELLLAQVLGAALVGLGTVAWFAREAMDPQASRGAVVSLLTFNAIGFVVTLLGIFSQVTRAGSAWLIAIIFLLFTAGYAYFQFIGPRE
jgi:hypothetical protein